MRVAIVEQWPIRRISYDDNILKSMICVFGVNVSLFVVTKRPSFTVSKSIYFDSQPNIDSQI